jgi:hypothetical protein
MFTQHLSNAVTENIKEQSTLRSLLIVNPNHQFNEKKLLTCFKN